jgi:FMN phosphatase YigB (HAD superfamily)
MALLLERVRNLVWDFDGVKYSYDDIPGVYALCDRISAENAVEVISGLDFETALLLGQQSYAKHGDSIGEFLEWARAKGLDPEDVRMGLFRGYHSRLKNHLERHHPHVMARDEGLVAAFEAAAAHIQHGIATHSCIDNWARPFLDKAGLLKFFNQGALVGLDHVDFVTKSTSARMVQECLSRLGADPKESGFVEDSLTNLGRAKDIDPHLVTIYVHQGKPLESLPPYVDHQTENNRTLMRELVAAKGLVLEA